MIAQGRLEEGLAWMRRARELDPFSPIIAWNEVRTLYLAGEFETCIAASDRYEAEFGDYRTSSGDLCAAMLGDFSVLLTQIGAPDSVRVLAASGNDAATWHWLATESGWRWSPAFLWRDGRQEEAFAWFDRALGEGGRGLGLNLAYHLADPMLEEMRRDPRWKDRVLERVELNEWPVPPPVGVRPAGELGGDRPR